MGFIFRLFRSQFVQHLLSEGMEVIESEALAKLQANQKKTRGPKVADDQNTAGGNDNG